jgi:hypothetical protein
LFERIQIKESMLCKLRNKDIAMNLKEVCQLDSNPLIWSLSSSNNVQTSRFLGTTVRNNRHKAEGRSWSYKGKVLALSLLKCDPRSYSFLQSLFLGTFQTTLKTILSTVCFRTAISFHVFSTLKHYRQCLMNIVCIVLCLMKCQSQTMCVSVRSCLY